MKNTKKIGNCKSFGKYKRNLKNIGNAKKAFCGKNDENYP